MVVSGEQNIRGIDIDKLAKGFADEQLVFKQFLTITPTSAREVRWYQKTAGFLDSTDTTAITASQLKNNAQLALPQVVEQSWTRNTSYVRKFFVESPWLSIEDIRDSDIDVLATNIRDLTKGIMKQVDSYIFDVMTESNATGPAPSTINYTMNATGAAGWGGASANPILDLLSGAKSIMTNSYDTSNLVTLMHPNEYTDLMNYLITVKGSSVPSFASDKVENGVLMNLLGQKIVVSNNVTTGYVLQFVPQRASTWKSFMPITAQTKEEIGIGSKIRVWEEGVCLLTDPKAVHLLSGA